MPRSAAACLLWFGALTAPVAAQTQTPDPPGRYAVDVRGASSGVPQDARFFPPVPSGTIIPPRGFGIDIGGHVYLMRLGAARLGVGANLLRVRGASTPQTPVTGSTATTAGATHPDIETTLTTIAPQVSFNFGTADGWSYISAGLGRARVRTATSAFAASGSGTAGTTTPARSVDSGMLSSINVGGGARWFVKAHLAFAFDVRFHLVSAGSVQGAIDPTPRTTLVSASVGISLR